MCLDYAFKSQFHFDEQMNNLRRNKLFFSPFLLCSVPACSRFQFLSTYAERVRKLTFGIKEPDESEKCEKVVTKLKSIKWCKCKSCSNKKREKITHGIPYNSFVHSLLYISKFSSLLRFVPFYSLLQPNKNENSRLCEMRMRV